MRARRAALWPSPPGQPKVLVIVQGFSELLDGALLLAELFLNPLSNEQLQ